MRNEKPKIEPLPKKSKYKILIVDDHPIMREGLSQLINAEKDLMICGQFEEANKALDAISSVKPDIAIVDISLKGSSGIELLKNIKV